MANRWKALRQGVRLGPSNMVFSCDQRRAWSCIWKAFLFIGEALLEDDGKGKFCDSIMQESSFAHRASIMNVEQRSIGILSRAFR